MGGDEPARLRVPTAGELCDEQVVAEASEVERSQSYAPRSVEPISVFETHQELACRTIDVHKAQAWTVAFEGRTFLVQHIGDNNIVADGLHIERHVRVRKLFIHVRFLSRVAVATFGRILVDLSLG